MKKRMLWALVAVLLLFAGCDRAVAEDSSQRGEASPPASRDALAQDDLIQPGQGSERESSEETEPMTPEEMAEYRALMAYRGLNHQTEIVDCFLYPLAKDQPEREMIALIFYVHNRNLAHTESFASPQDPAAVRFMLYAAASNSYLYQWYDPYDEDFYFPDLARFPEGRRGPPGECAIPRDHIERNVQALFGEVCFKPQAIFSELQWSAWTESEMFYYTPLCVTTHLEPVILSYEEDDDYVTAEVVFVVGSADFFFETSEFLFQSEDGSFYLNATEDELEDHLRTMPRYTIVLQKQADGGFLYYAQSAPQ